MRHAIPSVCAFLILLGAGEAHATPLRLDYQITPLGGGIYQYDFTLTLDNHDSSWAAGQQWDWIMFGDNDSAGSYAGFDVNGQAPGGLFWTTLSFSSPISYSGFTTGGHNGPSLDIGASPFLPGWEPTAVGQSLTWSGTSSLFIPTGMVWSSLIVGGSSTVQFEGAYGPAVPEPSTWLLLGTGLAAVAVRRRFTKR